MIGCVLNIGYKLYILTESRNFCYEENSNCLKSQPMTSKTTMILSPILISAMIASLISLVQSALDFRISCSPGLYSLLLKEIKTVEGMVSLEREILLKKHLNHGWKLLGLEKNMSLCKNICHTSSIPEYLLKNAHPIASTHSSSPNMNWIWHAALFHKARQSG